MWRHRFTTDSWAWELPMGLVEESESPEGAAAREVLEETGWRPGPIAYEKALTTTSTTLAPAAWPVPKIPGEGRPATASCSPPGTGRPQSRAT
jgi:8-oxo-dGTP pyrophosphatase MutT (NUDIX family)